MSTIALENANISLQDVLCDMVASQMGTDYGAQHLLFYRIYEDCGAVYLFGYDNSGGRSTEDYAVGRKQNASSFYRTTVQLQATVNFTERRCITRHYKSLQKIGP
jgi:hypothetical protein